MVYFNLFIDWFILFLFFFFHVCLATPQGMFICLFIIKFQDSGIFLAVYAVLLFCLFPFKYEDMGLVLVVFVVGLFWLPYLGGNLREIWVEITFFLSYLFMFLFLICLFTLKYEDRWSMGVELFIYLFSGIIFGYIWRFCCCWVMFFHSFC